jgi:acetyl esterase/lipase
VTLVDRLRSDAYAPDLRGIARVIPGGVAGPRLQRVARLLERLDQRRKVPADVEVVAVGPISVQVHRPPQGGPDRPAILWLHGGGYIGGSPAQDRGLCRQLAEQLGALVVGVDYRTAPEHPFPTPLEDCYAALAWLAGHEAVDAARIAVAGSSAGGGLAAALALLARDRGEHALAFQALSYPMIDDRTTRRTHQHERWFRAWNTPANRWGWRCYLGAEPGTDAVDPGAVPSRREDLAGLPPTWIGVGTLDLFHAEDLDYARRLRAAGVPCETTVIEGAFHGFDAVAPRRPTGRAYRDAMLTALATGLRT